MQNGIRSLSAIRACCRPTVFLKKEAAYRRWPDTLLLFRKEEACQELRDLAGPPEGNQIRLLLYMCRIYNFSEQRRSFAEQHQVV